MIKTKNLKTRQKMTFRESGRWGIAKRSRRLQEKNSLSSQQNKKWYRKRAENKTRLRNI